MLTENSSKEPYYRENKYSYKDLNKSYDFNREMNELPDFALSPRKRIKVSPQNHKNYMSNF